MIIILEAKLRNVSNIHVALYIRTNPNFTFVFHVVLSSAEINHVNPQARKGNTAMPGQRPENNGKRGLQEAPLGLSVHSKHFLQFVLKANYFTCLFCYFSWTIATKDSLLGVV